MFTLLRGPAVAVEAGNRALWSALVHDWPSFAAFVISFLSILIIWSSHHNMFMVIKRVDHTFLLLNGLVLLGVTAVPYPTQLLAQHFGHPAENTAALVYAGVALFISASLAALWWHARRGGHLYTGVVGHDAVRAMARRFSIAPLVFACALVLAPFSAIASVLVFVGVDVFFAFPARANRPITEDERR